MNFILGTLAASAPLLLASMAALTSEFSGCMALFLDGLINLSAFLCFAFTTATHSLAAGIFLSVASSAFFIGIMVILIEKLNANKFLAALAINLLCTALSSTLSSILFGTRGVLTDPAFVFSAVQSRIFSTIAAYILAGVCWAFLTFTKSGLYIRISGNDSIVLRAKGTDVTKVRFLAWTTAAVLGSFAGSFLCIRISSFVPNISSGTGWTALAAVFLGKKNTAAVITAVLVFSAAQYGANNIQNIELFKNVPSAVLLSLPYLVALLLILIFPQFQRKKLH